MDKESFLKPDLQTSLLCDDVRQEINGKFMLIGIFERLGLKDFPGVVPKFCIVNRWCCGEGTYIQQTRIIKPDGIEKLVEGRKVEIKLQNESSVATSVEFFVNMKFDVPGIYWVEVTIDQELKIRYPLLVAQIKPQPQQ